MSARNRKKDTRVEKDLLGERTLPADALWGIHTLRAIENFPLAGRPLHPELARAFGSVKLACARVNRALGAWHDDEAKADAIERAAHELAEGLLSEHIVVDALQGGAGTSTNMNANEVIANRALQLLGEPLGSGERVHPIEDVNLHQSTNDTYPTALKVAAIRGVRLLEQALVDLQESLQRAEQRFADVVKVGRTQMQDAALITLGREMGAYAEAIGRDRWRVSKCVERLRVVNLGGTAIGTGLGAPIRFVFGASDELRALTGLPLARAENLVDATQNQDAFVEVSGILKASATNLLKISGDLRLMSSGPQAGLGEIKLPPRQAGSSIMPGKVNPVIPEAVSQAAMLVMANDQAIAQACASGSLELNPFLPLVAHSLLQNIDLLARSAELLRGACIEGLEADEERCAAHVGATTATATALVPELGYESATRVAHLAAESGRTIREVVLDEGLLGADEFDRLVTPEAVCRLGGVST